jgi:hypothetical protein
MRPQERDHRRRQSLKYQVDSVRGSNIIEENKKIPAECYLQYEHERLWCGCVLFSLFIPVVIFSVELICSL